MSGNRPLTEQELEIMKVVWDLERATVREVFEVLRQRKKLAYTTVMTMMGILESKGHLEREREGRAYVYRPVESKSRTVSRLVDDFVDRVFGGSARPLLLSLVKDHKVSEKDLEEIRRMIEEEK